MTVLYYSDTDYDIQPPEDISLFLLRLYRGRRMLAICAREGMQQRIRKMIKEENYVGPEIVTAGVWDLDEVDVLNTSEVSIPKTTVIPALLKSFDVVVLVGKDRVHEDYKYIVEMIEETLC